jgi:hypothetical protein
MSEDQEKFEGGECPCQENQFGASSGDEAMGDETTEPTPEELEEMMSQIPPEILAPDLPMLLASIASTLENQAWRHLGLIANPITHQAEKDLQKSRIAIDIMAYIVNQVAPLVSDSQRRDLQSKVATLQMNFVEQSKSG